MGGRSVATVGVSPGASRESGDGSNRGSSIGRAYLDSRMLDVAAAALCLEAGLLVSGTCELGLDASPLHLDSLWLRLRARLLGLSHREAWLADGSALLPVSPRWIFVLPVCSDGVYRAGELVRLRQFLDLALVSALLLRKLFRPRGSASGIDALASVSWLTPRFRPAFLGSGTAVPRRDFGIPSCRPAGL